jgi:dihydropteroate synthase
MDRGVARSVQRKSRVYAVPALPGASRQGRAAQYWKRRDLLCSSAGFLLDSAGATANIIAMTTISPPVAALRTAPTTAADILADLLALRRPLVMGVLNVTPDSFSDGGAFLASEAAIARAGQMISEGADIIDVGAESTRPYGNAVAVPAEEERRRLETVLPAAVGLGRPVSIDTMKAAVAEWALEQGAAVVNDVWGLQRDPRMAEVVARYRVPVIVMHNRDVVDPQIDIMTDIAAFFERSLVIAERAGIARSRIVLDPGIGFGKTQEQSLTAIARLDRLKAFGLPVLVGASRKRFIDAVVPSPPDRRLGGSIAAHVLAVQHGATFIRAHDVAPTVQALRVMAALHEQA